MPIDLLKLPFAIQISLGSGYLAYLIAYAGIRQHHNTTDAVFRTLAFGIAATATLGLPISQPFWLTALAFLMPIIVGVFWRKFGMKWSRSILRQSDVTWSDDLPSAWISLTAEGTNFPHSQISVDLEDGRMLHCSNTRLFAGAPYGPCLYGLDGSIALYVTDEIRPDHTTLEHEDIFDAEEGWRITYIPADQVKRVDIRLLGRMPKKAKSIEETPPNAL